MNQDYFLLASLLFGTILAFVGLTSLLPVELYRKVFGYVLPVDSVEPRNKALQRRMIGVLIAAIGLTALRAGIVSLFQQMK